MSEISSQTISLISKSRTNLLEQLEYQGYDTNDYNKFSIEEINAMFINKQLDMTLVAKDAKKTHVIFHIEKTLRKENVNDYIEKIYNVEQILSKNDMLVIVMKTQPNDTLIKYLKHVWEEQNIFIVIHGMPKLQFNLLKHDFVPPHTILTKQETEDMMKKFNIMNTSEMPDISRFDPVALSIGLRPTEVCKVIRTSKTAIQSIYYRFCSP
jgi:DNA-directed RNA polymerase I, II, and III subunit RPABC1